MQGGELLISPGFACRSTGLTFLGDLLTDSSSADFKHNTPDWYSGRSVTSCVPHAASMTAKSCQVATHLQAQYSKPPLPLPIRVSLPLTQTGTSGNTRIQASAPLTGLILRLIETRAEVSCEAVRRAEARRRMPNAPCRSDVPLIEPPCDVRKS